MDDDDNYENESYRPVEYKKTAWEKAKEAGERVVSGVFLVIQLLVWLFILGLIARLFGFE